MNGVADSLPSGSGNLDVRLGRQRLPILWASGSGSAMTFAPNIAGIALFLLTRKYANNRFDMA